jgi:protein-tyrosine phosphatase
MIDIHAHILPALDDGPQDIQDSIEICKSAYKNGIKTIVATPHIGRYDNNRNKIINSLERLKQKLSQEQIEITLYHGADILFNEYLPRQIRENSIVTINGNGRYFLLEFPQDYIAANAKEIIFQILTLGVTPIITHPERNKAIKKNPKLLFEFICQGALSQLTAASLLGGFGRSVEILSHKILINNLVHVIATDVHSLQGRSLDLKMAVEVASQFIGEELSLSMVTAIPEKIIHGNPIDFPEPICP